MPHVHEPASGEVRARVVVVHGLGDHRDALPYRNLRSTLLNHNLSVYTFDLRGHGTPDTRSASITGWQDLVDDTRHVVDLAAAVTPARPVFLVGLSLGGLLALNAGINPPDGLRGLVALAPAVSADGAPLAVRLLMPLLSRVAPRLRLDPGLDRTRISRDAAAASEYLRDPLVQTTMPCRLAAEVIKAIPRALHEAAQLTLPLLVLHGTEDTIVPAGSSAVYVDRVTSRDKTRVAFDGAFHNLLIETNRDEVMTLLAAWINARC